jgi:hypothetical protein
MTKAKKGLIITLFAAMMVFAFGATSAFAADSYMADGAKWTNNFQTATINGADYGATLTQGDNGMIHASVTITGDSHGPYDAYFYDLTGAKLFDTNGAVVTGARTFGSYSSMLNKGHEVYVQTQKPSYFDGTWTSIAPASLVRLTNFTTTVATETVTTASKGDKIDIETEITTTVWSADGTAEHPYLLGDNPKGTVTLSSGSSAVSQAGWYKDEAKNENYIAPQAGETSGANYYYHITATYDGDEHTLLWVDPDADKVTYEKRNARTGEWEPTESITYKDAVSGSDAPRYRAQVTTTTTIGTTTTTTTAPAPTNRGSELTVNPSAKDSPTFGFMWGGNTANTAYELTKDQTVDPTKFVELKDKGEKADAETLMAFFADVYDIDVQTNVGVNEVQRWTFDAKEMKQADVDALNKKYETLLDNYNKPDMTLVSGKIVPAFGITSTATYQSAYVMVDPSVNPNTKTDHIYFTEAPNMTYKAKKIKKASKSFTVAAVADSGNAVTYKISSPSKKITINSETGKVTVKKGLKKGTYKVKVYAQTAGGNGYAAAYTYQPAQITIKIKK